MAIKIERNKKWKIDPMTSDNINRKSKIGLSSDSRGLDRSGITKYGIALVNRVVDIIVMMTHRSFFVLTKDY